MDLCVIWKQKTNRGEKKKKKTFFKAEKTIITASRKIVLLLSFCTRTYLLLFWEVATVETKNDKIPETLDSVSCCVPLGIFCSRLKMGLVLMSCLALKKCMAGGNSGLIISSIFILNRSVSSCCSASVSTICPPVCMEVSSCIRASLSRGSGMDSPQDKQHRTKKTTAAWGRCNWRAFV